MSHHHRRSPSAVRAVQTVSAQAYEGDPDAPPRLPRPGEFVHATVKVDPQLIDSSDRNKVRCVVLVTSARDDGTVVGYMFGDPAMLRTQQGVAVVPNFGPVVGLRYSANASTVPGWRFTEAPAPKVALVAD